MSFKRIGTGLPGLVADWIDDPGLHRALVAEAWELAAGPAIARRTRVRELADGVLRVRLLDPAWTATLAEMAPELLARLRAELGSRAPRAIEWV